MGNSNFKDSVFNEKFDTIEKVNYLGDLRIIGCVIDSQGTDIGYVIMTEKTQKFKMYTIPQTISLIARFKFVNAKLEGGKVTNTECSMSRLPKFDMYFNVVSPQPTLTVLGEIFENKKHIGYRVLDKFGKIVDISEGELINLYNLNYMIVNAKVVCYTGHDPIISAIKGEFTKIEKKSVEPKDNKNTVESIKERKRNYRNQLHINKLLNEIMPNAIIRYIGGTGGSFNTRLYSRSDNFNYLDLSREAKILVTEIYGKGVVKLTDKDKDLIKQIVRAIPHNNIIGTTKDGMYHRPSRNIPEKADELFWFLMCQFILNDEQKYEYILGKLKRKSQKNVEKLLKSGFMTNKVIDLIGDLNAKLDAKAKSKIKPSKYLPFETTEFKTGIDAAQLGFAVNKANDGIKFETKTKSCKTLKYLGNCIPYYNDIKIHTRCLGDLLAVANVEKLRQKYNEGNYIGKEDILACIEIIIAISFIYNNKVMVDYLQRYREDLEYIGVIIPDFNELSTTDFKIPSEIDLYYSSGFNVFFNDEAYIDKEYTGSHLHEAMYINYRQMGNRISIEHPLIKCELASIINMITSDNCESELIDKWIGKIRFI